MSLTLRPYQIAAVEQVKQCWTRGHKRVLVVAPTGAGKCLGLSETVLLHDGTIKTVQSVQVGDRLQGPDGPRAVLSVSRGFGPLYRIKPVKGRSWVCNDVHVMTVVRTQINKVFDIPLNKLLKLPSSVQRELKLFIPESIEFEPQPESPIDPYFLGLWFGDGSKSVNNYGLASVDISKPDTEVLITCQEIAKQWGLRIRTEIKGTCPTHHLVGDKGLNNNQLIHELRKLIGENQTIPKLIYAGSKDVRSQFLAGILDADGHLTQGCYDIVQKRKDYAETVAFIARSLGLRASDPSLKQVNGDDYWRVSISGDASALPMRIPRKKASPRLQKKDVKRTGFTVEPIGNGDYYGFTLDGDGRFLLGDFTVTHNTALAEDMILRALSRSEGVDIWFLAHRVELLDQPARRFQKRGISFGIVKSGVQPQPNRRVQIASVQTLKNRPVYESRTGSALVFIDEAHRSKAATYISITRDLQRTYSSIYTVGLTATPYRLDGQGLGDVTDALVEAATPRQLMDLGYLTDDRPESRDLPGHTPCVIVGRPPPDKIDPRAVDADGEFLEEVAESLMDRPKLVGDSVETWRKHCDGYPGIGRCVTKASALKRAEAFKAAGFRVGYLDGETPRKERQLLLARLAIGGQRSAHPMGLDVLFFVNVLTEGFDSESSYDLVLNECRSDLWLGKSYPPVYMPLCVLGDYAPTQSMGAFIQFWGRGSRVHKDKPWLRFLSHAGNEDDHCYLSQHEGFSLEHRQSEWLSKMRAKEAAQGVAVSEGGSTKVVCADCQTRWLPGTKVCLHCGGTDLGALVSSSRGRSEGDEEAPGELVEKTPDAEAPRPPTPFETEQWFTNQFSWLRSENARRVSDGKKAIRPGMIVHKYRGIFKRDPDWSVYNRYRRQYGFIND